MVLLDRENTAAKAACCVFDQLQHLKTNRSACARDQMATSQPSAEQAAPRRRAARSLASSNSKSCRSWVLGTRIWWPAGLSGVLGFWAPADQGAHLRLCHCCSGPKECYPFLADPRMAAAARRANPWKGQSAQIGSICVFFWHNQCLTHTKSYYICNIFLTYITSIDTYSVYVVSFLVNRCILEAEIVSVMVDQTTAWAPCLSCTLLVMIRKAWPQQAVSCCLSCSMASPQAKPSKPVVHFPRCLQMPTFKTFARVLFPLRRFGLRCWRRTRSRDAGWCRSVWVSPPHRPPAPWRQMYTKSWKGKSGKLWNCKAIKCRGINIWKDHTPYSKDLFDNIYQEWSAYQAYQGCCQGTDVEAELGTAPCDVLVPKNGDVSPVEFQFVYSFYHPLEGWFTPMASHSQVASILGNCAGGGPFLTWLVFTCLPKTKVKNSEDNIVGRVSPRTGTSSDVQSSWPPTENSGFGTSLDLPTRSTQNTQSPTLKKIPKTAHHQQSRCAPILGKQ